jgi:hypothetical protein
MTKVSDLLIELRKVLDDNEIYESDNINSYLYTIADDANLLIMQGYPASEVIIKSIDRFKEYLSEDYEEVK